MVLEFEKSNKYHRNAVFMSFTVTGVCYQNQVLCFRLLSFASQAIITKRLFI